MLQFVADGEFDLVRRLDRRQVALQNDAIGRAETIHPGAVAADKNWDVTHAAARGRRLDPRFERAIVERLIGRRERFDPYRQNDQSQKCERNQRKGTIEPPAARAFYNSAATTNLMASCTLSPFSQFGKVWSDCPTVCAWTYPK